MAGTRERFGVSNSISSRSPGFSNMPAYNTMPPSLSSVPRPSTTVVEKPLDVTTRTGMSTGRRFQRRVFPDCGIVPNHLSYREFFQITKVKWACGHDWRSSHWGGIPPVRLMPLEIEDGCSSSGHPGRDQNV